MSDFRTLPSLSYHEPIPNLMLNTLLFCFYNESSTFYIFMLYLLIHTVLAVEFFVVLWNRVYHLCTLYVLKGGDMG